MSNALTNLLGELEQPNSQLLCAKRIGERIDAQLFQHLDGGFQDIEEDTPTDFRTYTRGNVTLNCIDGGKQ